jgi:hypothetical protein
MLLPRKDVAGSPKSLSNIMCTKRTGAMAFAGVGEEELGRASFAVRLTAEMQARSLILGNGRR